MIMLWNDPVIHEVLAHQKLRLQDMPGLCVACPMDLRPSH